MSDSEVVKKNTLNECMHNLTLVEMRLMQLAIVDFRNKSEFDEKAIVEIHANNYAEMFNVSRQTAHKNILEAEKTLFQRQFTFINENGKTVKSRWIAHVEYSDNSIKIGLSMPVIDAISRIDGKETPFTKYHIEQTHSLNSRYSLRLYELVVQYLKMGKTPLFELKKFRFQLGLVPDNYKEMKNFKKYVLDLAVGEINEKTNLSITYEQKKKGRIITGFIFTVHEKHKEKDVTPKASKNNNSDYWLSEKQLLKYASLLAHDKELEKYCRTGASYDEFAKQIIDEFNSSAEKRAFYKAFLIKHGFDLKSVLSAPPVPVAVAVPVPAVDENNIYKTVENKPTPQPTAEQLAESASLAESFSKRIKDVIASKKV